ncbi:hypothetical protein [Vibrio breoganii]|uniref:hypothetical protein n=1 Tax=Vibrio breoganii TaxID=553239 RepID=UPI0010564317|nr:hypothetical protein [Vibrio breoganii]
MLIIFWDKVSSLDLWDDDDFMRLVQISDWIASGNWYLHPMERLNPEDGQIMHWTRVPDIIPYLLIRTLSIFTDSDTATIISISIAPLLYLCFTVICICATTIKLFGQKYAFISAVYALSSYLLVKFLPGSIDHHNVQLSITALFILLLPFKETGFHQLNRAWVQGMLVALSLWVGVANLLFFISALSVLVLYAILRNRDALRYTSIISISAFSFSILFILLNRPYTKLFDIHIDALSIPFSFCFLSGFLFCYIYEKMITKGCSRVVSFIISLVLSLSPTLVIFPQLITDFAYKGYPEILRFYWLDLVSETFSTIDYIKKNGVISSYNILLIFAPALLSIFMLNKDGPVINFYAIFIATLAIPLFWQDRASITPVLLAVPLQCYIAVNIAYRFKSNLYRMLIIMALSPIFIGSILDVLNPQKKPFSAEQNLTKKTQKHHDINHFLAEIDLTNKKVLAPVDFGTRLLALTNASVISVPYHRNINGNTLIIELFLNMDLKAVKKTLLENNVTHVIIGDSQQSKALKIHSDKDSFINQLDRAELPNWLTELYRENGIAVFQLTASMEGASNGRQ